MEKNPARREVGGGDREKVTQRKNKEPVINVTMTKDKQFLLVLPRNVNPTEGHHVEDVGKTACEDEKGEQENDVFRLLNHYEVKSVLRFSPFGPFHFCPLSDLKCTVS